MLTLDFRPLDVLTGRQILHRARRVPLLQTYDYARAVSVVEHIVPRWALVQENGQDIGFVQFFEARLAGGFLHALVLDRGPVWFEGAGEERHHSEFWRAFDCLFPRRLGRRRRVIPEFSFNSEHEALMIQAGFRPARRIKPYQTFWLDLTKPLDVLRAELDGKWRNCLVRAEKNQMAIFYDDHGALLPWLLTEAEQIRRLRGFKAASPRLVIALTKACLVGEGALIVQVQESGHPLAGGLFLLGGGSATYQVGWVSPQGRDKGAGYLMLWQAIVALQARGVRDLDLGGGNDEDAAGVTHFKAGVKGDHVTLVGQFY